jgi:hypothetical protein
MSGNITTTGAAADATATETATAAKLKMNICATQFLNSSEHKSSVLAL